MKTYCKVCGIRIYAPENGVFCSDLCRETWEREHLPEVDLEPVEDAGDHPKILMKINPGCYMRTNLQNND